MRDGARMTVRSRPTSKHVPRKERRYHVKNSDQEIFRGNTPDNPRKEPTTSTHVSRSLHWK